MNTELMKRLGVDITDADKRSLRFEAMKLTDAQLARLKDNYPKGTNYGLITKIDAFRMMRKRQWNGLIKIVWWLTPTIGVEAYCTEERFKSLAGC